MVTGLDRWQEFFADYKDKYVLIGGAACHLLEEELDMNPRATKDLDLVLIVEAITPDFGARLWEFIKKANYKGRRKGESEHKHEYYRFVNPDDKSFPKQIELFARNAGLLNLPADARIEPISLGEDLSSVSAILMDSDYYAFTIKHSKNLGNIHIASAEALICLKAKAYIDMLERRDAGESVDSRDIEKHKKDVFRLIAMLPEDETFPTPNRLRIDIEQFCNKIGPMPNAEFFKNAGLMGLTAELLIEKLKKTFDA
ncbi:MAG: hypothetical protein Q4B68_00185 [Bacteroidales bacterium]|nr:hypothetical protein [Bacteroidales bacterium]